MITTVVQRWREGRDSYRPAGEPFELRGRISGGTMGRPRTEIPPGTMFGFWTVLGDTVDIRGERRVAVRCQCGTNGAIAVSDLRRGGSKSCGCMKGVLVSRALGLPTATADAPLDPYLASAVGVQIDGATMTPADLLRFRDRAARLGPGECWPWQGAPGRKGYGRLHLGGQGGRHVLAHRLAYAIAFGGLAEGAVVCHRCDNPPCVNPAHLFAGTQADNIRDAVAKGRIASGPRHGTATRPDRIARGERHHGAVLTADAVCSIRTQVAHGSNIVALATVYGVTAKTIRDVAQRRRWRHLP